MTVNPGIETTLEVWELTLPEDEAKCEWPISCSRAPEWAFVVDCGCSTPMCDPHRSAQEAECQRILNSRSSRPYCKLCGADSERYRWNRI